MKFQKKIIAIYMIFSILITGVFGSIYYILSAMQYTEREYTNIRTISDIKLEKIEDLLEGMSSVITYFLSDVDVLDALQNFAQSEKKTYEEIYYDEAASEIRNKLTTYYLIDGYYRVVVFNKAGNVISNTNYGERVLDQNASYINYPYITPLYNFLIKKYRTGLSDV